jgi:lipopolysaccharide export LptBFGC system permease protein LptF
MNLIFKQPVILQRYLNQRLRASFLTMMTLLTVLLSTQALLISLNNVQLYCLSIKELFYFFILELASSLPLIINFSFIISWLTWQRTLEDNHEEHAVLLSGWSGKKTRILAFRIMIVLSFINLCTLFMIVPFLTHTVHKTMTQEVTMHTLTAHGAYKPIKISEHHVLYFKGQSENFLHDLTIITAKKDQTVITKARSALLKDNGTLILSDGELYPVKQADERLQFDSMDFLIRPQESKLNKSGMTFHELKTLSPSGKKAELGWRIFLIIQPWIVIMGFLNKKIVLRKNTSFNRLLIEAIVLFCTTTLLGLFASKLCQQGLFERVLFPLGLIGCIAITGMIRSFMNDQ